MNEDTEWITMAEASRRYGFTQSKLSRWAKLGKIKTRRTISDERARLVFAPELEELIRKDRESYEMED